MAAPATISCDKSLQNKQHLLKSTHLQGIAAVERAMGDGTYEVLQGRAHQHAHN